MEENKKRLIEARDFENTEISDINKYINTNIPYSVLQQIYPLTENVLNKAKVYTIMFRIIYGVSNYVENQSTKKKIDALIAEHRDLYAEVYELIIRSENNTINFGSRFNLLKLKEIFIDFDKNFKINKLIDIFLIFSEKVTLLRTDNFASVDIETKEGEEVYNKLASAIDKTIPADAVLDEDDSSEEIPILETEEFVDPSSESQETTQETSENDAEILIETPSEEPNSAN